MMTGSSIWSKT